MNVSNYLNSMLSIVHTQSTAFSTYTSLNFFCELTVKKTRNILIPLRTD